MKNTFNIVIISLIATIFLASCHSSLSITKRRASRGYFVNYSSYKGSSKQVNRQEEESIDSPSDLEFNKTDVSAVDVKTSETSQNDGLPNTTNSANPVASVSNQNLATSIVSTAQKINVRKKLHLGENKTFSKIKAKLSPSPVARGDGLSLLWVVIIILLVLWALGLIAGGWGLGGFIHILLLIALILLILWLLRII